MILLKPKSGEIDQKSGSLYPSTKSSLLSLCLPAPLKKKQLQQMKNVIIIPCYNEAGRLKFDEFLKFIYANPNYLLCFVNDGSKDETLVQLEAFANGKEDQIIVFNMPENGGKAEAVRSGMNFILDNHSAKTIGFLDADLATGFDDYKVLVNTLETEDQKMVFGSRKMETAGDIERSVFRKLASGIIGLMIKIIIGLPIKDSQCGAKVFQVPTAKYVFRKSFMSRWLFDVEMFIRIKNLFDSSTMEYIKEVAVTDWEEVEGSHITLSDSLKFPKELLQIGFAYNVKPVFQQITKPQVAIIRRIIFREAA